MTQTEVKSIVKRMVSAGESDGVIKSFIQEAMKRNSLGKKNNSAKRARVGSSLAQKSMDSKSVNGSSVSPLRQQSSSFSKYRWNQEKGKYVKVLNNPDYNTGLTGPAVSLEEAKILNSTKTKVDDSYVERKDWKRPSKIKTDEFGGKYYDLSPKTPTIPTSSEFKPIDLNAPGMPSTDEIKKGELSNEILTKESQYSTTSVKIPYSYSISSKY